jgi:hypothetical protein
MKEAKEYKNLHEFLLNESTVFQKKEDMNPLYYIWAVVKSANGKTEDEIKKDESLKALFKKLDKFCEDNDKYVKKLKDRFSPAEFQLSFQNQTVDNQKKTIEWVLDNIRTTMSADIKSFNEWKDFTDAFDELRKSEEMQVVINSL